MAVKPESSGDGRYAAKDADSQTFSGNVAVTGTLGVTGATTLGDVTTNHQTLAEGKNMILGTTTGSQVGTATGQKLGFWGATPVVQQVFATGASHTVDQLITVLQTLGIVKQS